MSDPRWGAQADTDQASIADLQFQADVDHLVITQLEAEGIIDRGRIHNLETALITARRIGAAIGILTYSERISEGAAFERLRKASHEQGRKVRDLADDIVLTGTMPS